MKLQLRKLHALIRSYGLVGQRSHSRGMTLIEIMVVVTIITLIMGGVGLVAFNRFQEAQVKTGKNQTKEIQAMVETYRLQKNGKCPKTLADLKSAGVSDKTAKDPWGNEYTFKCPGEHTSVDVMSAGPDGEFGTNDDLTNYEDENAEKEEANE